MATTDLCVVRPNPICPQCRKELDFIRADNKLTLYYVCSCCGSTLGLKLFYITFRSLSTIKTPVGFDQSSKSIGDDCFD